MVYAHVHGACIGVNALVQVWGDLIGRIAQQYPHLVALDIDDFSSNVGRAFTGNTVALITSNMRAR